MTKNQKILMGMFVIAVMVLIAILTDPIEVWARAGGGRSSGGGILGYILYPFFLIYSAIVTYLVRKKNKECQTLLDRCASLDQAWNPDIIKARIELAFFKIQQAWMERNQDIAKDYMSERLYSKHKAQTDAMIANKRKNILEGLNLINAKIVQVADFKDNSKDTFLAYIKAAAIDYEVNIETGRVTDGEKDESRPFSELWKFIRTNKGWVVDEIDQKVTITDFSDMKSFIE